MALPGVVSIFVLAKNKRIFRPRETNDDYIDLCFRRDLVEKGKLDLSFISTRFVVNYARVTSDCRQAAKIGTFSNIRWKTSTQVSSMVHPYSSPFLWVESSYNTIHHLDSFLVIRTVPL